LGTSSDNSLMIVMRNSAFRVALPHNAPAFYLMRMCEIVQTKRVHPK
jgi:hypothetical protein